MKKDYKFKFRLKIIYSDAFKWYRPVKFRGANFMDFYWLRLKISIGLPYLHSFIWNEGYEAGFRGD